MKSLRILILVLGASAFAFGADPEFKGIVHSIERTYGVHHTHIPFLGMAMFFARPAGVHGFKLAVFEGFQSPNDSADLRRTIESSLGTGWYPFVRVRSKGKADGETTLIYTSPCGNRMRMMIVSLEPSEAVVIKMELSEHAIEKWLKEPGEQADGHSSHHPRVEED
jgi:Methyl-CpG binding domain